MGLLPPPSGRGILHKSIFSPVVLGNSLELGFAMIIVEGDRVNLYVAIGVGLLDHVTGLLREQAVGQKPNRIGFQLERRQDRRSGIGTATGGNVLDPVEGLSFVGIRG